jgi:DNA polymerase (family 10)
MLAASVIREARRAGIGAEAVTAVGSLRRFAPDIGDVSLLGVVPASRHKPVLRDFARLPIVSEVRRESHSSITVETTRGEVTLYLVAPDQAGAALVWHTGSRAHVDALVARATRMGLRLSEAGLAAPDGSPLSGSAEEDLYSQLELPFIAPELRSGGDELDAAERGHLPQLISELHIRGDLHVHSTWSDGRDSIADMVSAARQLGYEYIAITDHSERAWSSRSLSVDDVARQRAEIESLRAKVHGIDILHGVEVDIMPDGSLDFEDTVLEGFDIVLASLHEPGGQDGVRLTERYLQAVNHPLVNIITHPANRSPAQSGGYLLDFDRLFAAAAETGTALEIDGAPGHLDLDGSLARRAAAAGATIAIDSDSHRFDVLGRQMRFGIGTARRGWIEPQQVLNVRSAGDIRAFVARKRARLT